MQLKNIKHLPVLLVLTLLISACQSTGQRTPPVVESRKPTDNSGIDSQLSRSPIKHRPVEVYSKPPQTNAAVIALLDKAHGLMGNQEYVAAAASLERAIRISPRNPKLYLELAKIRHKQSKFVQADQLCKKAIALSDRASQVAQDCKMLRSGSAR